jgi:hypothetical protein
MDRLGVGFLFSYGPLSYDSNPQHSAVSKLEWVLLLDRVKHETSMGDYKQVDETIF